MTVFSTTANRCNNYIQLKHLKLPNFYQIYVTFINIFTGTNVYVTCTKYQSALN